MRRYRHTTSAAMRVIALDIYGTIIDVGALEACLGEAFGARAKEASRLWRQKQLEFSFRRGLMRKYVNFDVCTRQALIYVSEAMGVHLDKDQKRELFTAHLRLPAFPDARDALRALREDGNILVALTNGTERSVRAALRHAGVIQFFENVISVDPLETFKPDPVVYGHLLRRVRRSKAKVWLVSGNPWDVIGAKACGLKTVWLQRDPALTFDPWEFQPNVTISSLERLCERLPRRTLAAARRFSGN